MHRRWGLCTFSACAAEGPVFQTRTCICPAKPCQALRAHVAAAGCWGAMAPHTFRPKPCICPAMCQALRARVAAAGCWGATALHTTRPRPTRRPAARAPAPPWRWPLAWPTSRWGWTTWPACGCALRLLQAILCLLVQACCCKRQRRRASAVAACCAARYAADTSTRASANRAVAGSLANLAVRMDHLAGLRVLLRHLCRCACGCGCS